MPANSADQTQKATFVFQGTVKKLKAATMKGVPVDDRTAVVRVNQVIEAPKNLAGYAGQDITVQLSGRQKISEGQELIFHTQGWIYGDSIAVQSLSQEPVKRTQAALLSRGDDPVKRHVNRNLRERFDDADVVVSGRVAAVRLPQEERKLRTLGARAAAEPEARGPVSEHDPKWREAIVEVDDVHKGSHDKKEVVVRFPSSTDVRWYKAPKFHPGQQGFFMLHKTKIKTEKAKATRTRAAKLGAEEPEEEELDAYTALHPADFQPFTEPGGVKTLIEASADEARADEDKG